MSPRPSFVLSVLVLVTCVSGCAETATEGAWTVTRDTLSNGAVHVVNTPPQPDPGVTSVLVEEIRIGTVDGVGPSSFGQLKGLAVTLDGRIVVLDAMAQEIRTFAPDGRHLATHGGKGAGPGELEAAFGLMKGPNDLLWVPDHRNARMSVFDAQAGFRESHPLRVLQRGFVWGGAMAEDGRVLKPSITLGPPRRNVLRVYESDMSLVDSLPWPDDPEVDRENPPGAFYWEAPSGRGSGYYGVPFYPQGLDLIDPNGSIWSTASGDPSYRIKRWVPGGDTTLVLETRRAPTAIPEAERDSAISAVREFLLERGGADQDWTKVPTVRPAVATMFVSEEGDLWVQLGTGSSTLRYDVYHRDGTYSATVETSLRVLPWVRPVVRGAEFWAVVTDELDVPFVVRARIVPVGESG